MGTFGNTFGNALGTSRTNGGAAIQIKTFGLVVEGHSFLQTTILGGEICKVVNPSSYYNSAVSGSLVSGCVTRAAVVDSKLNATYDKNIIALYIGVNDISTAGTGTSTYNAMKAYVQVRLTAGWEVFAWTCTPSTASGRGATFEAERVIFNNLMRNDLALLDGVYIVDTDAITEIADSTNTTYYADALHLTDLGYYYLGAAWSARVNNIYSTFDKTADLTTFLVTTTLTSTGTGVGISTLKMTSSENVVLKLSGTAKFYANATCTTGESSIKVVNAGSERTIYLKCPSGVSDFYIQKNKITSVGVWTSLTNAASWGGDITALSVLATLTCSGNNALTANLTDMNILSLDIAGSNTVYGDITTKTSMTKFSASGYANITGDITNHTSLTYLSMGGYNTNSLYGDIGVNNMVNGIVGNLVLSPCHMDTYTAGAVWSNTNVTIAPSIGYGYSQAEIISILTDIYNSVSGPSSKAINFSGANASMADTTQGGIWGDFDGETTPSAFAVIYKALIKTKLDTVTLIGITVPGVSGDGTGFPTGFGDWYRS